MSPLGGFVRLNLGPRFSGVGSFVALNLGVNWDDNAPEPVIRGVRGQVSLAWAGSVTVRRVTSAQWAEAQLLAVTTADTWNAALSIGASGSLHWGLATRVHGGIGFTWRRSMGWIACNRRTGWSELPVARRGLTLAWRPTLSSIGRASQVRWQRQGRAHASRHVRWQGQTPRVGPGADLSWSNPVGARVAALLPWGPARRVPWGVHPGPGPGPNPDPDPTFPPGNRVGLNLGCAVIGVPGLVPLNLGISACYVVRPQRRTYVVINEVSFVRLPDRVPIELARVSLNAGRSAWGWTFDIELADADQLGLLKPTASGPRQFELVLNGYVWTGIIESFQKQREFAGGGVRLSGRSRTALLAPPYAPARVKATTEERSMAQLVAEELADTGFASDYQTVDWPVPPGAWFYDASTPLDAISALAGASGGVVQSHPSDLALVVRPSYPASPWLWRETTPDHVLQEDIVLTESLQMRSAPLYDAVVVTGELAGKGVTCKVRKAGEAGQLFAQQASSPLISVAAAAAERGRNILCDRGEQAAVDLTVPLFPKPLKAGEIGVILPLDLVQVLSSEGTWHGQCESIRIEVVVDQQAVVIEQTATLERHFTDAD
ncbi:hypothetical protein EGJ24_12425 [Stenotrophomonas maltophilia]|nr:hypothetical protein EGJ24_12425 [Stenotrophomonas maltophilia]